MNLNYESCSPELKNKPKTNSVSPSTLKLNPATEFKINLRRTDVFIDTKREGASTTNNSKYIVSNESPVKQSVIVFRKEQVPICTQDSVIIKKISFGNPLITKNELMTVKSKILF